MRSKTVFGLALVLSAAVLACSFTRAATPTAAPSEPPVAAETGSAATEPPVTASATDTTGPALLTLDRDYFCNHGPGANYLDVIDYPAGTVLPIIGQTGTGWWLVKINDERTSHLECWIGGGIVSGSTVGLPIPTPGPFVPVHDGTHWPSVVYLDCTHLERYTWVFGGVSSGEYVATEPIMGFNLPTVKYEEWMPVCPSFSP